MGGLLPAIVGLGRVGQDLDDDHRVDDGVRIFAVVLELATDHADVGVGRQPGLTNSHADIGGKQLAGPVSKRAAERDDEPRSQRSVLARPAGHREHLAAQILVARVARRLGGEVLGVGHACRSDVRHRSRSITPGLAGA